MVCHVRTHGCLAVEVEGRVDNAGGAMQEHYARIYMRLITNSISQRCWSMEYHRMCPPDCFAGVLHSDDDVVESHMRFLEQQCQGVVAAEAFVAAGNKETGDELGQDDPNIDDKKGARIGSCIGVWNSCWNDNYKYEFIFEN